MFKAVIAISLIAALVVAAFLYFVVVPRRGGARPLPELDQFGRELAARLETHIQEIADGPRNMTHYRSLQSAATYIAGTLTSFGYQPTQQVFEVAGKDVRNIEILIAPETETDATQTLVLGAHYDTDGASPGANDNGTGVAAALELAHLFRDWRPKRHRLRIVFWVNEEHPWGRSPTMGSWQHAERLAKSGENVIGAIALETLGYFSETPGSQKFPSPFEYVYSDVGDFVAFVALPGSRRFLGRVVRAFRQSTQFPSIGGLAPSFIEGVDLSDHWAYDKFGFPALMVTDTAPFRNPYYHGLNDLPDNVDYTSLAHITLGLRGMVRSLVD